MTNEEKFEWAIEVVLRHEGGYTLRPSDPGNWTGGKIGVGVLKGTNMGISAASYPNEDIKGMTKERAKEIYRRDYWNRHKLDEQPAPLALMVADTAINQGNRRAEEWLARTKDYTIFAFVRSAHYTGLVNMFPEFGRGWMIRLWDVLRECRDMENELLTAGDVGIIPNELPAYHPVSNGFIGMVTVVESRKVYPQWLKQDWRSRG